MSSVSSRAWTRLRALRSSAALRDRVRCGDVTDLILRRWNAASNRYAVVLDVRIRSSLDTQASISGGQTDPRRRVHEVADYSLL